MLGFVAFVAMSLAVPVADDAGLRRMVEATHQICSEPSSFGYTLGGAMDADAQAKIPKVLSKLLEVGLSGALKAHGEVHGGPAQKDVGSVQAARLQCAQNVFADLSKRYNLTTRDTGKPVYAGPRPIETFRQLTTTPPQLSGPVITNGGSGNQIAANNQNDVINNNGTIGTVTLREDRHIYIAMLQDIYTEGQSILLSIESRCPTDEATPANFQLMNQWVNLSRDRIAQMMTPAAALSFLSVMPGAMQYDCTNRTGPKPSQATLTQFTSIISSMPQYLNNIKYLMENDTMDPQNKASGP
jgi:hypothetical protein